MLNIIAIEGIDRIGKSTFINELQKALSYYYTHIRVEKPSVGLNTTRDNSDYPLLHIPGIMEIRNIGLFEELLFQCKHRQDAPDEYIIRDRFNLSELAYGDTLRPSQFGRVFNQIGGVGLYKEWNRWFEHNLQEVANIHMITFVLDDNSYPNEDEAVTASDLVNVNETFKIIYDECTFQKKMLIQLKRDDNGYTDIMSYLPKVINWLTNTTEMLSIDAILASTNADEDALPKIFMHTMGYSNDVIININGMIHCIGTMEYETDSVILYNNVSVPVGAMNDIIKDTEITLIDICTRPDTNTMLMRYDIVNHFTTMYNKS